MQIRCAVRKITLDGMRVWGIVRGDEFAPFFSWSSALATARLLAAEKMTPSSLIWNKLGDPKIHYPDYWAV